MNTSQLVESIDAAEHSCMYVKTEKSTHYATVVNHRQAHQVQQAHQVSTQVYRVIK